MPQGSCLALAGAAATVAVDLVGVVTGFVAFGAAVAATGRCALASAGVLCHPARTSARAVRTGRLRGGEHDQAAAAAATWAMVQLSGCAAVAAVSAGCSGALAFQLILGCQSNQAAGASSAGTIGAPATVVTTHCAAKSQAGDRDLAVVDERAGDQRDDDTACAAIPGRGRDAVPYGNGELRKLGHAYDLGASGPVAVGERASRMRVFAVAPVAAMRANS